MLTMPEPGQALTRALEAAEDAAPLDAVEAVTGALADTLRAEAVSFLIADLSGRALVRLSRTGDGPSDAYGRFDAGEHAQVLPFDGGPAEEAVRTQSVQVVSPQHPVAGSEGDGSWVVLAPVTERGEVLGLLELTLPAEPDAAVLAEVARVSHLLSFVIIANRRHTDLFEWGQRTAAFSLPAEIQRRLLPAAFTCEAGAFTLSAWLEPAATIGGDTFDYSLGRDVLHLSMTDAMGHGVASALSATLCVGSLRNSRRAGVTLHQQAVAANKALCAHAADTRSDAFATGLLGRLDLRSGTLEMVNAGHVLPYLCRRGRVTRVDLPADLPLGMFPDTTYHSTSLPLQPGDRLVLLTDGMLERGASSINLAAELSRHRELHPREATRALTDRLLQLCGPTLGDDATVLLLDWYGHHGQPRVTSEGAAPMHASPSTPS